MRVAALSTVLLALVQHVFTLPVEADTKVPALGVTLSHVSDTRIKAVVKNIGNEEVTFVHFNFFRDSAPVKKVSIYQNGVWRSPGKTHGKTNPQLQTRRLLSRGSGVALH